MLSPFPSGKERTPVLQRIHQNWPFFLAFAALSEPDDGVGNVTNPTAADKFGPINGGKKL